MKGPAMFNTNTTLAQLATTQPGATRVFLRHRLDFCCGGRQTLVHACHEAGLNPEQVLDEIATAGADPTDERWETKPLPELVQFIVTRYHDSLRVDLPALLEAAQRVERVHADKPSCPHGLAAEIENFQTEILQHLAKEEHALFPAIVAGSHGVQVHMPVRVLMQEHDDHGANLKLLRELATDYVPPAKACATWRALYSGLEKLEAELMQHIHLENNVLFPRALNN